MKKDIGRSQRVEEELTKAAATFLNRESNRNSLITVTRTILSNDTRTAHIMVSVLPKDKEEAALHFLKRMRPHFKQFLKKSSKLPRIPFVDFCIDIGEINRQRLEELSDQ